MGSFLEDACHGLYYFFVFSFKMMSFRTCQYKRMCYVLSYAPFKMFNLEHVAEAESWSIAAWHDGGGAGLYLFDCERSMKPVCFLQALDTQLEKVFS